MKREAGFRADDGTWFSTAVECRTHERKADLKRFLGLDEGQLQAGLDRADLPLANAIELAGNIIAKKRRADGGLKRKRKTIAEKRAEGATIAAAKADEAAAMVDAVKKKQKTTISVPHSR